MHDKQYPNKPSSARMYDYFLGGTNYFPIDEEAAERVREQIPSIPYYAHMNRDFLRRVVTWLSQQGISQFLDLGSGIPTMNNVHEVAKRWNPAARVVYVDNDPLAVTESRNILESPATTTAILADFRDTEVVLQHPDTQRILDFTQPLAVLFLSILHFFPDHEEVMRVVQIYRDATVSGSYLALSHGVIPEDHTFAQVADDYENLKATFDGGFAARRVAHLHAYFGDYTLMAPGLVPLLDWHPDDETPEFQLYVHRMYGGIGRKDRDNEGSSGKSVSGALS